MIVIAVAVAIVIVVDRSVVTCSRFRLSFVPIVGHCSRKLKRSALYRAVIGVVIVAIVIVIVIALHVIDCPPNLVNRPIGDYQVVINRI